MQLCAFILQIPCSLQHVPQLWFDKDAEADWVTVQQHFGQLCNCLHSKQISWLLPSWAACLIPVRWCLVSNLIKLLDAIPVHNVWIMFVWQTCSLLESCAHTACCSPVSTLGHSRLQLVRRDEGRGISAGWITHQDLWMKTHQTQRGQREGERVVTFGKF